MGGDGGGKLEGAGAPGGDRRADRPATTGAGGPRPRRLAVVDAADLEPLGLSAYFDGRLGEAISRVTTTLSAARVDLDRRKEALALVILATHSLALGACACVAVAIHRAEAVYASLEDADDRVELPLLRSALGVLEAMRGHRDAAEAAFDDAVDTAAVRGLAWHLAVARGA